MKMNISDENLGLLCICALRYCFGRQSYMPSLIQDIVKGLLPYLPDNDINIMVEDTDFQSRMNLYGDEHIDKPGWLKWAEIVKEEKERRKNDLSR